MKAVGKHNGDMFTEYVTSQAISSLLLALNPKILRALGRCVEDMTTSEALTVPQAEQGAVPAASGPWEGNAGTCG